MELLKIVKSGLIALMIIGLALVLSMKAMAAPSSAHPVSCEALLSSTSTSVLPQALFDHNSELTLNMSQQEAKANEHDFVKTMHAFQPQQSATRASAMSFAEAQKLYQYMKRHPVVGVKAAPQYAKEGVELGYCFGRATFMHLLLLKLGLQKESIFKVWAVGPMNTGLDNVTWSYHVASIAYTRDQGWVAIDTDFKKALPIADWVAENSKLSIDHKMQFYLTEPQKFGINLGKYSRDELGLDLDALTDVYKNYFKDMMKSLSQSDISELYLNSDLNLSDNLDDITSESR